MTRSTSDDALLEVVEEKDLVKPPSVKEIYTKSLGKEVSLDFFLFTAYEQEVTFNALKTPFQEHLNTKRWPLIQPYLKEKNNKADDENSSADLELTHPKFEEGKLVDLVASLCSWYGENYPLLKGDEIMDYEVHAYLLHDFIFLSLDFSALVSKKLGKKLAAYDSTDLSAEEKELWACLEQSLKENFSTYSERMLAYFKWVFSQVKTEEYDFASLPPVGRYSFLLQQNARRVRQKANEYKPKTREQRSAEKRESEKPGNVSAKGAPQKRNSNVRSLSNISSQAKEKEALQEVDEALATFAKNAQLTEIQLRPQNSYIRRLQHKNIVDSGFKSASVGEGSDRAVKALRSKKK